MDAAMSSLQHMREQEQMLTSMVLPADDPIEAVFKAPESLPHSYLPSQQKSGGPGGLAAPVSLRVPRSLLGVGRDAPAGGGDALSKSAPADALSAEAGGPISYNKVRRWDMLPKHAWLQAAESGQAPGPGFRDVSATQTMRSYGPKGADRSAPRSVERASVDFGVCLFSRHLSRAHTARRARAAARAHAACSLANANEEVLRAYPYDK